MAGRFSFSTPESGHSSKPWFRLGTIDVNTTVLVVILCVTSMFVWAIDRSLLEPLILWPEKVLDGQIWRLITWPIPTEPSLWTVITLAVFWYFGREIEGLLGRNRFAWFLAIVTVVPGIVGTLIDIPEAGIRPIEFAVFLVFIAQYPFARFFFGIPAWALGLVFIGVEVLQLIGLREEKRIVFLFVTLVTAAITARSFGLATSLPWIPKVPLHTTKTAKPSKPARSSKGTVVEGPWSPPTSRTNGAETFSAQVELDELLDKISAGGMESLSSAEKRRLNELSKRLR